ncbi:MAG: EAL domain-containing protein [Pseudomonadota bacterium]|nr:EAL domain-containing protein [Pseudomonadota bacterium]
MNSIKRDSLQWKIAASTFSSIILSTVMVLGLLSSLLFPYLSISTATFVIYLCAIAIGLIIIAMLFASRTYQLLARLIENLDHITTALPLLSSKRYDEAKKAFSLGDINSEYEEITQLQFAVFQLTSLLQKLDSNVTERSQLIYAQKNELQTDRDFIKNLLDTAQLIILTTDDVLKITMFNDFAEKITGFTENDMIETAVSRVFPAGNWTEAKPLFKELLLGNMNIAQQEAEMIDVNGHIKQISWLHSRIVNKNNAPAILSVGLDMTSKKEAEKRIIWMAEHDPLTDLANRRKFTAEFEKSLQTSIRYQHNNALLYLDLDEFKDINDTSGHGAGDELLQAVAETLKKVTRYTDLVARLGGDEFAILIPETDNAGAVILAKKIITELAKIKLSYGEIKHKVSTSIGIVHYPYTDADIHELLGFADLAMYKAKANGKGTYHTFSVNDKTKELLETRVLWKHKIENALEKDLFVLYFQPIMNIKTNTIQHYEVLIRMRDSETGEISLPGKFIEIAEETGLINSIDHYVIKHSMMKLAALQDKGITAKLAINLSGAVVDNKLLLPLLRRAINEYKINPGSLIFEITETAAVSNFQQAKLLMEEIRKLGCQFSLDDFGVGFSSFNYLRELPVDIIKIDGIFIKDLDKNADDQLFVKALVDVAKGLGKKTIAEYVENKEILAILEAFGFDYAQGYYIARPNSQMRDGIDWQPDNQYLQKIPSVSSSEPSTIEDDLSESLRSFQPSGAS